MGNPEIKFLEGNSSGKWSRFTVDSVEYVIKFDVKEERDMLQAISCTLSDYQSTWIETITSDEFVNRLKRCNPLLACQELMTRIIWTVTGVPQNGDNVQITALNDTDFQHLSTKYYLSDGSDPIPLKFYWSLEKGTTRSIYEMFNEMLMKITDMEKTNAFLQETIRIKDQECSKATMTQENISANGAMSFSCTESVHSESSIGTVGFRHEATCNNCGLDIFGNRYNCLECKDYDLCMTCEHREMQHTHHIMVRYAQQIDKVRSQELLRVYSNPSKQRGTKRTRSSKH